MWRCPPSERGSRGQRRPPGEGGRREGTEYSDPGTILGLGRGGGARAWGQWYRWGGGGSSNFEQGRRSGGVIGRAATSDSAAIRRAPDGGTFHLS